jgi:hypothetical protein
MQAGQYFHVTVGKGKRFAKADLDAKSKHGTTQPSTGAEIFVSDVGSQRRFQPKLEMYRAGESVN